MKKEVVVWLSLILFSCETNHRKTKLESIWNNSCISYTAPSFYVDGLNFHSEIWFTHKVVFFNNENDTLKIEPNSVFFEKSNSEIDYLIYLNNMELIKINPKDSISIDLKSKVKFKVKFNEKAIRDSIYPISDSLIKVTRLFYISKNDTIEIEKSKSFYTDSKLVNQ